MIMKMIDDNEDATARDLPKIILTTKKLAPALIIFEQFVENGIQSTIIKLQKYKHLLFSLHQPSTLGDSRSSNCNSDAGHIDKSTCRTNQGIQSDTIQSTLLHEQY